MTGEDADEWLRPIDPMVDSDAPEQIAIELGRRHALYLREAQRLVLDGKAPDRDGLADGIRAETRRYLRSHPWLARAGLAPAVAASERAALASLAEVVAAAAPTPRPFRRLALQPSATVVGNMALRKRPAAQGVQLSWDAAANVVEWTVRVSVRPDPRQDYVELEAVTLPAYTTTFELGLDECPRRIQLHGLAGGGRIVRRAIVSALTSGNSGAQWKRQASAS